MMDIKLDKETQLALLQKHTLMKINDILDQNFLLGQIFMVEEQLLTKNSWIDNLVKESLDLIDAYKIKRQELTNNK